MFERLDPPAPFRPSERFRSAVVERGRRIRRRRRRVAGSVLGTLVVMAAVVGVTAGWSRQRFDDIQRVDVANLPETVDAIDGEPFTVLVVGVDGPRTDGVAALRTDTIMAVHVRPAERKVDVTSIPRDLWVAVPGHGEGRINTAFEVGGASLLVGTVESALHIDVDRYLQVDFDGFRELVDAAGGVPVRFATPVRAASTGLNLPTPGCWNLDGDQALALARSRKDFERFVDGAWRLDVRSDLGRIDRQQAFGMAALGALGRLGTDGVDRLRLLDVFADHVAMDHAWTREQLEGLVELAGRLGPEDVSTSLIPVEDAVRGQGAQVLLPTGPAAPAEPPADLLPC